MQEHKKGFEEYRNTHHFLPSYNNNLVPNTVHVLLHFQVWICFLIAIVLSIHTPNRWGAYYQEKLKQLPRPFVVESLNGVPDGSAAQLAFDLGAGVGHETLLLLQKGYTVIALDNQQEAIDILRQRAEIVPFKSHLITMVSDFENIDFNALPFIDLVIASYALPFCKPQSFDSVWNNIKSRLNPGAYFIGHFFDPGFTVFKESDRKAMTFHTKEQILDLFEGFEILRLNEIKEPAKQQGKVDHYYEIVARKIA